MDLVQPLVPVVRPAASAIFMRYKERKLERTGRF